LGYKRYLAGELRTYKTADEVKVRIHEIGFKDAFVVAFYNGERISITDARNMLATQGTVQNATNANTTTSATNSSSTTQNNAANTNAAGNTTTGSSTSTPSNTTKTSTTNNPNVGTKNNAQTATTEKATGTATAAGIYTQATSTTYDDILSVDNIKGLFYTVQVGVYSQITSPQVFYNLQPLRSESLTNGQFRYSVGIYSNTTLASQAKNFIHNVGVTNAFVTAYYNGKRISLTEAQQHEADGTYVIATSSDMDVLPYLNEADKQQAVKTQTTPTNRPIAAAATTETTKASTAPKTTSPAATLTPTTTTSTSNDNIVYKVQIGAYKEEVPIAVANIFFKVAAKGIDNYKDANGVTIYTVGKLSTYEEANVLKNEMIVISLQDAFIVAFKNGIRVQLSEIK
jgi:cell division septation protein DedD